MEYQVLTFPVNKFLYLVNFRFKFDNEINRSLMSSIIEVYFFDIFISYRQKDNKGDQQVTNFKKYNNINLMISSSIGWILIHLAITKT